ncbi:MAG: cob(I)yrinic acid a,c-diamide adenosyltransferase [Myxococcales bacterium]
MKIYTRGGDKGQTNLLGGKRVGKDDPRVDTYGTVDELNAVLGLARAAGLDAALDAKVARIQHELFAIGSRLATPSEVEAPHLPRIRQEWIDALEAEIDEATAELPPLRQFVLPAGAPAAAALHLARTVCRRAERAIVKLARDEEVAPEAIAYVNRLSDWLFTMARAANHRAGAPEVFWAPPRG